MNYYKTLTRNSRKKVPAFGRTTYVTLQVAGTLFVLCISEAVPFTSDFEHKPVVPALLVILPMQ
jgi:hypothetical protein